MKEIKKLIKQKKQVLKKIKETKSIIRFRILQAELEGLNERLTELSFVYSDFAVEYCNN